MSSNKLWLYNINNILPNPLDKGLFNTHHHTKPILWQCNKILMENKR